MKRFRFLFALFVAFSAILSCQDEPVTTEDDMLLTDMETVSEELLAGIDAMIDEALLFQSNPLKSASADAGFLQADCPLITIEKKGTTQIMTLDFGDGCTGKDKKVRSGKIIVESVSLENHTFERIKTFDNFMVEGKKVEGIIKKNVLVNREEFTRTAAIEEDVSITFPEDQGVLKRKSLLTKEYKLNLEEKAKVMTITSWGTAEIIRPNGVKLSKRIDESDPLVFDVACRRIVSGTVSFTSDKNQTWSIDYGDGDCDNLAVITKNGESRTINLKKR